MPAQADPAQAAWLTPDIQTLVACLLQSHRRAYGTPLLAGLPSDAIPLQWSQALFAAATVVLAHDGADPGGDPGPRLIYANRAAIQLWRRPWAELVGMPSRLTAEPAERAGRTRALASVQQQHAIANYSGIRIDSQGRRFRISGARVWTVWRQGSEASPEPCGQAAAFSDWHWL
jgi:hypothetical protein